MRAGSQNPRNTTPRSRATASTGAFGYFVNPENVAAGAPKTLVFQGSYMNEMGFKFLQTGLGEYIYVHDYENLMDFDYYFNIFQPECVVVEVAEYTVNSGYFNAERVENFSLNSVLTLDDAARAGGQTIPRPADCRGRAPCPP